MKITQHCAALCLLLNAVLMLAGQYAQGRGSERIPIPLKAPEAARQSYLLAHTSAEALAAALEVQKKKLSSSSIASGCTLVTKLIHQPTASPNDKRIIVRVTMKNNSQKTLYYPCNILETLYEFRVINQQGKAAVLTDYGYQFFGPSPAPNPDRLSLNIRNPPRIRMELAPGLENAIDIEISKLYDLSTPGDYFVTAMKSISNTTGNGVLEATSNTIKIKVATSKSISPAH